jgi:hypothetical protein
MDHHCPAPHPIGLAQALECMVRDHAMGIAARPISRRRGAADQRPCVSVLRHILSIFDQGAPHDVVAWHGLPVHSTCLWLG